jgi:hypothetical protein
VYVYMYEGLSDRRLENIAWRGALKLVLSTKYNGDKMREMGGICGTH